MIVPVRCFTCGKPVSEVWEEYNNLLAEGKSAKEALDAVKLKRYCCRSVMLSHVETIDIAGEFK